MDWIDLKSINTFIRRLTSLTEAIVCDLYVYLILWLSIDNSVPVISRSCVEKIA